MKTQQAITLIELMIALCVLGVLTIAAIPGLTGIFQRIRMDNDVNSLMHSFHRARQNALVTGVATAVCCSSTGVRCDNACEWTDGWLVFANNDDDEPPALDPGEAILESASPGRGLRVRANRRAFILRPFGLRSTNGTLTFCDARGANHARAVIISYTGKPRISSTGPGDNPLVCAEMAP